MRAWLLVFVAMVFLSGCVAEEPGAKGGAAQRRVAGEGARMVGPGPVTVEDLNYTAPPIAGPWMAAFWLRSESSLGCQATFKRDMRTSGGLADTIMMVAKGWSRPEVVGGIVHDYRRGDGFVVHAGVPAGNHTVKGPPAPVGSPSQAKSSTFKVQLPPVAFIAIGNSYMHNGATHPSLDLRLECERPFQLVHQVEGPSLAIYGPEDFNGFVVDTEGGFGAQRDAQRTVAAKEGLIALLHEDANQGNAQYTTTKPDGARQVDTLGNRIAVGPAGAWKFGLDRVSLSPGGEFRLFAFDVAIPAVDEPKPAAA